jgi:hypothetical protein
MKYVLMSFIFIVIHACSFLESFKTIETALLNSLFIGVTGPHYSLRTSQLQNKINT